MKDKVYLETPDGRAVMLLDWDENKKSWVVTAFKEKRPVLGGGVFLLHRALGGLTPGRIIPIQCVRVCYFFYVFCQGNLH